MKSRITSHLPGPESSDEGLQTFGFTLYSADGSELTDQVTLQMARRFSNEITKLNAFTKMMRAIAYASPADYDSLVGQEFFTD